MKRIYGWKRQAPDARDWKFVAPSTLVLPSWIDQRANAGCPAIYDQLQIGSCTSNAGCSAFRQTQKKEGVPMTELSRLDLYNGERILEGTQSTDSGATIRDTMKAAAQFGICTEAVWPYGDGSTFANPPAGEAAAPKFKLKSYLACADLNAMLASLALGYPVVFGIDVYESFESNAAMSTGMIPMPGPNESLLGGHALKAVGFRMSSQRVIFANSWGEGVMDKGYGYIPFAYLRSSMASDFWTPRVF